MSIVAALFGLYGVKFWWKGLAAVIAVATFAWLLAIALQHDEAIAMGLTITPGSAAYAFSQTLVVAFVWFWVGAGLRWVFRKLSGRGA